MTDTQHKLLQLANDGEKTVHQLLKTVLQMLQSLQNFAKFQIPKGISQKTDNKQVSEAEEISDMPSRIKTLTATVQEIVDSMHKYKDQSLHLSEIIDEIKPLTEEFDTQNDANEATNQYNELIQKREALRREVMLKNQLIKGIMDRLYQLQFEMNIMSNATDITTSTEQS